MITAPLTGNINDSSRVPNTAPLTGIVFSARLIPVFVQVFGLDRLHGRIQISTVSVRMIYRSRLRNIDHRVFFRQISENAFHIIAGPCPPIIRLRHLKALKTGYRKNRVYTVRQAYFYDIAALHDVCSIEGHACCPVFHTGIVQIFPADAL